MTAGVDSQGSEFAFHRELQTLLHSPNEEDCRAQLLQIFRSRNVAGAVFLSAGTTSDGVPSLQDIWAQTIQELPDDTPVEKIIRSTTGDMPRWMRKWLTRRQTPFSLSGITRYIPYTSQLIFRLASPKGVRPLIDMIWSPYQHRGQQYAMCIGLFERATPHRLEEINSLALAYIVKWTVEVAAHSAPDHGNLPETIELTGRELDCLRWLIAGKTLRDTADILGMSYANVRYHVDKAKQRHGYATTRQLMVRAAVDHDLSPWDGTDVSATD